MSRKGLYQDDEIVYRIYDPVVERFCCSGRGLYANNGRSVWFSKSAAIVTTHNLPPEIGERVKIRTYRLVEVDLTNLEE